MNKNTIIGIILIAFILIGYSIYNTRQYKAQMEVKRVQDSILAVESQKYAEELALKKADSILRASQHPDASAIAAASNKASNSIYSNSLLERSHNADSEIFVLENNLVRAEYTSRGAQPYSVQIKGFYTSDSTDLFIMKEKGSTFGVQLFTSQLINTDDFTFDTVTSNDSTLIMRLYFSETAYLQYAYFLPEDSYLINLDLTMVGMNDFIPRNATQFDVLWNMDIPRLEKGYDNEKNYSTIDYKYPNDKKVNNLGLRKAEGNQSVKTKLSWFAFQQQFFSAILLAENDFSQGNLSYKFYQETDSDRRLMACSADVQVSFDMATEVTIPLKFYFGPNRFKTLKSYDYGFEKIVPLGGWLIGWINRLIIIPIFDLFDGFIGSYGIIILLMTILIKLVISPLTIKSYMSSAKMNVLKPEIEKINAKYPRQEDAMKKQQETMDLYKKAGVNMFGGCLPMLLQFPVLFAMFRFFPASFELRQQSFLWASDLSAYDSILNLPFNIPLYGDHVSLFAILMAVSMFFYSKMTSGQTDNNPQMKSMRFMTLYFMPIMMLFICNNLSSGLSYYYMLSNLITMLQTWVIRKYFVDEDKIMAQIKVNSAKAPKQKSKFQLRLEAAQKAQQEAMKNQRR